MSLLDVACETLKKNIGAVRCGELPAMPRLIITTPDEFSFAPADLADQATFKTAIQDALIAGVDARIYLWPNFVGFESVNEDAVYEESALADMFVRNGKYRMRFSVRKNLCLHKAMFTHGSNSGRAFIIDVNNKMLGTLDEETGNFYGLSISLLNPEKLIISDGTIATKSPIYMVLADSNEIDQNGVMVPVPFINTLKRLTDVTIAQVTDYPDNAATEIKVTVLTSCDSVPVLGLLMADFVATDASGDAIVLTAATPDGAGGYVLETAGAFDVGSEVTLRAPSLLTVTAYEAEAPAEVSTIA